MPSPRSRWATLATVLAVGVLVASGVLAVIRPWGAYRACAADTQHPEWSVARRWDEALLDAIRRALPAPTVHARNLYHTSAAMWDAWAAYDPVATGVFVTEKHSAPDVAAARDEAISYAAYRLLTSRYINAVGGNESLSEFADLMDSLCYPLEVTTTEGDTPAALGNRIAASILAAVADDGSNEAGGYAPVGYEPVNPPLVVAGDQISMTDPNRWQPLQIEHMISQNGIPVTNGVQQAIGPQWGHVASFAIPPGGQDGMPMDPGPPPAFGSDAYREQAVEVIRLSSELDPSDPTTIDVSPASIGGNDLGTNDGHGYEVNPVTGAPYQPEVVLRADFGRVMAEFWADGPKSETPPGHWNVIANHVGDELGDDLRIGGEGPVVDRLEWDVKTYLALNGAVHDAAIAAWGLKGYYDSVRPISMIRYMGSLGQSSDPDGPSYDPDGLPLVDGLIEVITDETTKPGGRHQALAGHEGEIAIRAWAGNPADPKTEVGGVTWIRAVEWVPYQLPTFVTPSFPGYVSGHSTFSRAAAEVMTRMTGSPYFPGGVSGYTIEAGSLDFEKGPSTDIRLEWATYDDAADQAGRSRLWGGIHISADDFSGRRIGAACGTAAWTRASAHFSGAATGS
ncbi:MAG TPA: vanadium-dependent haloperoxidase [Candidatus Limnocylindria bacterium]|nr:vanadium-dependent haloperoxidase [Candidatus Limnocylindria bacterium]